MASYFAESTLKTKQLATIRECLAVWGLITIYRPRGVRLGALEDFGFVTWIKFTWASPVTLWYSFPPSPPPPPFPPFPLPFLLPPLSLTVNLQSSFCNPSFILRWRQLIPPWKPCDLDNFFYPPSPPLGAKSWLVLWHAGLPFSAHYAWQTTQWLFCCLFNYPSLAFINFLLLQSNNVLGAYPWTIVTQEHKLSDDGCLLQLYISYFVSSSAQFKFLAASQTLLTIGINWRWEKP